MISDELKTVILNVLKLDDWEIADTTFAGEIPGWDSLSHVNVISAVEGILECGSRRLRFSS
jgi:acyl carrier protein